MTAPLPGNYRDVVIRVQARLVGEEEGSFVIVSCRNTPSTGAGFEGSAEYRFTVYPTLSLFSLDRWKDGEQTTLVSEAGLEAIHPGSATNDVELACVGDTITARVNDVEVASVQDEVLVEGGASIGAGVYQNLLPGTVEARFDNLEVIEPA